MSHELSFGVGAWSDTQVTIKTYRPLDDAGASLLSAASSVYMASMFGLAGMFPIQYMQAIMSGQVCTNVLYDCHLT